MSEENLENTNGEEIATEAEEIVEAKTDTNDKENTARILNENVRQSAPLSDDEARRKMRSYSRRGFLIGGASAVFGFLGYSWLRKPENTNIFTNTFRFNEKVSQLYYSPKNLAPEFPKEQITEARINGSFGLPEDFKPETWRLNVGGLMNRTDDLILSLDDIKTLPRIEMTTELKCIEGWSIVVNWAGARFSDFAANYQPQFPKYVRLVTPAERYYVGWDMPSILHPQTLLAYEMNGAPLSLPHGAPLRIVSVMKYGIKQIKRIGRIEFTDVRPKDYWAERGYDWYSGH
ncbi:molybdopterin-binding protein [soil metagenome]